MRILTCDYLIKKSFYFFGWCSIFRQYSGETLNHLLIHCDVGFALWNFVLRAFEIQWVDLLFG